MYHRLSQFERRANSILVFDTCVKYYNSHDSICFPSCRTIASKMQTTNIDEKLESIICTVTVGNWVVLRSKIAK